MCVHLHVCLCACMRLSSLLSLTFSVGSTPSGVYVRVAGIFEEREEVNGVTEKPTPMDTQKTSFFFLKKLEGKPTVLLTLQNVQTWDFLSSPVAHCDDSCLKAWLTTEHVFLLFSLYAS